MSRPHCPYLGLESDPTTALGFPSEGNFCHNAHPIVPVNIQHQAQYCLTKTHTVCPVYQRVHAAPLPAKLVAPSYVHARHRRAATTLVLALLLLGFAGLFLALPVKTILVSLQRQIIPETGQFAPSNPEDTDGSFLLQPSLTPFQPDGSTSESLAKTENCLMPDGWMPYVVNPTDSLFRLSVVYSISVETLQRINCMGGNTTILPGQVLYVPFVPTRTPSITNTIAAPTTDGNRPRPGAGPAPIPSPTSRPNVRVTATRAATPARTPFPSSTPTSTTTLTPGLPTATVTLLPSPTPTASPTAAPTGTIVPTLTFVPTDTGLPTVTVAPTNTLLPTRTPNPTNTLLPTSTQAPTSTPAPTNTSPPIETQEPTRPPEPTNTLAPLPTTQPTDPPDPEPTEIPPATDPPPVIGTLAPTLPLVATSTTPPEQEDDFSSIAINLLSVVIPYLQPIRESNDDEPRQE